MATFATTASPSSPPAPSAPDVSWVDAGRLPLRRPSSRDSTGLVTQHHCLTIALAGTDGSREISPAARPRPSAPRIHDHEALAPLEVLGSAGDHRHPVDERRRADEGIPGTVPDPERGVPPPVRPPPRRQEGHDRRTPRQRSGRANGAERSSHTAPSPAGGIAESSASVARRLRISPRTAGAGWRYLRGSGKGPGGFDRPFQECQSGFIVPE